MANKHKLGSLEEIQRKLGFHIEEAHQIALHNLYGDSLHELNDAATTFKKLIKKIGHDNVSEMDFEKESPIDISINDIGETFVGGNKIDINIETGWQVGSRQEAIDFLYEQIGIPENPRDEVKADLEYLLSLDDTFLLKSTSTNEYRSPTEETEEFNLMCNKIIAANNLDLQEELLPEPGQ